MEKIFILLLLRTKRMEWFRHIQRDKDDTLKECITDTIHKKRPFLGRR